MTTKVATQRLLNEYEVAALLNIEATTLRRWRWAGKGPVYRKIGSAVRYAESDLREFVDAGRRTSTSDPGPVAA